MTTLGNVTTSARAKALRQKIMDAAIAAAEAQRAHEAKQAELDELLGQIGVDAWTAANKPLPEKPAKAVLKPARAAVGTKRIDDAPPVHKRRAGRGGGASIASLVLGVLSKTPERAWTTKELTEEIGLAPPSTVLWRLVKEKSIVRVGTAQYRIAATEQLDTTAAKDRVSPERKQVLEALAGGPMLVNEICDKTQISFGKVMSALDHLFGVGRVARADNEKWRLA